MCRRHHREPRRRALASHLAFLAAVVLVGGRASAGVVPGGGSSKSDCYAEFNVEGATTTPPKSAQCTDGDPTCDFDGQCNGSCRFNVSVCLNQTDIAACHPPGPAAPLSSVSEKGGKPAGLHFPDLASSACGPSVGVDVALKKKGKKPGRRVLHVKAVSPSKPKTDNDVLKLTCQPNPNPSSCGVTGNTCPANPAGGPSQVTLKVLADGTDLDNGWTGTSHNFPVVKDASLVSCLTECDATTNPVCKASAPTGAGSANGLTFGPPLPLIAGGVAVCVVNAFDGPLSGTFHLDTGVVEDNVVNLKSEVFVTTADLVCPRCETGTCDTGLNRGKPCHVDGSVTVVNASVANRNFMLSKDCPPGAVGSGVATLTIPLRPNTGTAGTPHVPATTGDSKPCQEHIVQVQPADNSCGAAGCGTNNCTGDACVKMVLDPTDPAGTRMICQDVKGGLSQNCCNSNTSVPCYDTGPGRPGIMRTGKAVPATPLWPDPTYPKTAQGLVLVSTFCIAGTGAFNVDQVSGLPGPGAVIFNLQAQFLKP